MGVALSPYLVTHHPLLLIALSPIGRHLVLAASIVDPAAFVTVTVLRRLLFYTASFHLGRALGPWAIPWVEARAARFGRLVRIAERLFGRAPRLVVLLFAGPIVSVLAGTSGMDRRTYFALATPNLIVRALLVLGFATWLEAYLAIALAWIRAWWLPATVVLAAGVAFVTWRRRARALG